MLNTLWFAAFLLFCFSAFLLCCLESTVQPPVIYCHPIANCFHRTTAGPKRDKPRERNGMSESANADANADVNANVPVYLPKDLDCSACGQTIPCSSSAPAMM